MDWEGQSEQEEVAPWLAAEGSEPPSWMRKVMGGGVMGGMETGSEAKVSEDRERGFTMATRSGSDGDGWGGGGGGSEASIGIGSYVLELSTHCRDFHRKSMCLLYDEMWYMSITPL